MSKLSGISDYTSKQELNAELTMLHLGLQGWEYNWTNKLFFHCGVDGSGYYSEPVIDYCGDWNQLMPIAVELGVTYAVVSSYSGQFVSFQINGMYQGCDNRHTFEMDNPVYGDDLKVAMVKCCIKALEDLAQEETEYQVALAARCPELSREIVELSTQKTFKITKKVN